MKISIKIKLEERTCPECKDAHKAFYVRGHFRMVEGKKVYVKAHYRKR